MIDEKEKCIIKYESYNEFFDGVIYTGDLFARLNASVKDYIFRGKQNDVVFNDL